MDSGYEGKGGCRCEHGLGVDVEDVDVAVEVWQGCGNVDVSMDVPRVVKWT